MTVFALLIILIFLALMVIFAKLDDKYPKTLILMLLAVLVFFFTLLFANSSGVISSHIKIYERGKLEKVIIITGSDTIYRYRYKRE